MTNSEAQCLLTVRADAERTVPPDAGTVQARVSGTGPDTDTAVRLVVRALDTLGGAMDRLGAVTADADAARVPLAWATFSVRTGDEHDPKTGRRTGRRIATAAVTIEVRDFTLLPDILRALTGDEAVSVESAWWRVDHDNPAWAAVRADAIRAALLKGQDYAVALGGRVERVEHVADAGLLGGAEALSGRVVAHAQRFSRHAEQDVGPVLEPEPQTLTAMIDARFTTTVGALPSR